MCVVHTQRMKKFVRYIFGGLVGGFFLLWACLGSLGDGLLHIYFLDIGQGDSLLVRTPGNAYILIDGGPGDDVLQGLSTVMPFYNRTIDLMILSHPHADHVDGLIQVLERYDVRMVMITGVAYGYAGYDRFLELVHEQGVPAVFVNGRNDYRLGNVLLDIVFPLNSLAGAHFENVNNSSISFRLLYGKRSFYFSGDLEVEGEQKLLKSGLDLRSDVLKVGHHGSRTSSTEPFLDVVAPKWAVISCGVDNPFKHPHPETIEHLQVRDVRIYRTDLDGLVHLVSDGVSVEFEVF